MWVLFINESNIKLSIILLFAFLFNKNKKEIENN